MPGRTCAGPSTFAYDTYRRCSSVSLLPLTVITTTFRRGSPIIMAEAKIRPYVKGEADDKTARFYIAMANMEGLAVANRKGTLQATLYRFYLDSIAFTWTKESYSLLQSAIPRSLGRALLHAHPIFRLVAAHGAALVVIPQTYPSIWRVRCPLNVCR